jgi:GAF domain-containing protein
LAGYRSHLGVPLLREGSPIGVILVSRRTVRPFTDKQIELVTTFADQAVIAIENARLFDEVQARKKELTESLEQQTATSEVLQVISSSPGELAPVFETMLEKATRVCDAKFGNLILLDGDVFRNVAVHAARPALAERVRGQIFRHVHPDGPLGRAMSTKQAAHVADLKAERPYLEGNQPIVDLVDVGGARTLAAVPMLKENELIGAIIIYREEVRSFTDKQIELVSNFAKQAVIAIENTRLLKELRQRTADLTESLEQQTATSEVLQVISSSPGELQPVFEKMLENATRVCHAEFGIMHLRAEDGLFRHVALYNVPAAFAELVQRDPVIRDIAATSLERLVQTKQPFHLEDMRLGPGYLAGNKGVRDFADLTGARTLAFVPMIKDDEVIGTLGIYRREVRRFADKQVELLGNFARQAVIAIENTRLLNELREALEQQTATSQVLKVVSSSAGDLEPVFQAMLEQATRICEAKFGVMFGFADGQFRELSSRNIPSELAAYNREPRFWGPHTALGRVAATKQTVHIADMLADRATADKDPGRLAALEAGGVRTLVVVPMLKRGELISAMAADIRHSIDR